jgi:hypothetical protein
MPAQQHTKKANTPTKQRQWAHVRESEIERGASPGQADKIANGVIKKESRGSKKK